MMSRDTSFPARRAILTALKLDASVTVLVPAERIFPSQVPQQPTWPFVRYGPASQLPFLASRWTARRSLSRSMPSRRAQVRTRSHASLRLLQRLDGLDLELTEAPFPAHMTVRRDGTQILADPSEPNAWHAVVNLQVDVVSLRASVIMTAFQEAL